MEQITEINLEIFIYEMQDTQFLIMKPRGHDTKFPFRGCRLYYHVGKKVVNVGFAWQEDKCKQSCSTKPLHCFVNIHL